MFCLNEKSVVCPMANFGAPAMEYGDHRQAKVVAHIECVYQTLILIYSIPHAWYGPRRARRFQCSGRICMHRRHISLNACVGWVEKSEIRRPSAAWRRKKSFHTNIYAAHQHFSNWAMYTCLANIRYENKRINAQPRASAPPHCVRRAAIPEAS